MEQTIKNLAKAFIGESQARNRYKFYASVAKKEGFEQIAAIFLETADQEKEHANQLFMMIQELKEEGGSLEKVGLEVEVPTDFGDTATCLRAAISGENYEHSQMYPEFSRQAEQDNLQEVALRLKAIAQAEAHHEERYKKLLENVEAGTVFKRDEDVWWVCRECGYQHFGKEAPEVCPSCDHPRAYYQLKCEQF